MGVFIRNLTDKQRFRSAKRGLFIGSTGLLITTFFLKGHGEFDINTYLSEAYTVGALTGYLIITCISIYQRIREIKIKRKEKLNTINYFFFFAGMVFLLITAFSYFYFTEILISFIFLWVSFIFFVILVTRKITDKFIQ